jgi:hypothetical protein
MLKFTQVSGFLGSPWLVSPTKCVAKVVIECAQHFYLAAWRGQREESQSILHQLVTENQGRV